MDVKEWEEHRAHRQQVVADVGQWIGLADEDGEPIMDIPSAIELSAPETRGEPAALKLTVSVTNMYGQLSPLVGELIADKLGVVDDQGQLVPIVDATRFVVIERAGVRRTFRVEFVVAEGAGSRPSTLTIHGTDMLKVLSRFPAMSAPTTWENKWRRFTRDWVGPDNTGIGFVKPRDLAGMTMVTVADGATVSGPAEQVIRRVVSESFEAAFRLTGVKRPYPVQVIPQSRSSKISPTLLLRPTDKSLWEEVAPHAALAGVRLSAFMWWPGDTQPPGLELSQPTIVISCEQT